MVKTYERPMKVLPITDIDPRMDNALALAYLRGRPDAEIVAATTTYPESYRRAQILRGMLRHLNLDDVPVGMGRTQPLATPDKTLAGLGDISRMGRGMVPLFPAASEVIADAAAKYGSDLQIAAFAPLSDLAEAIEENRSIMSRLGGITVTAGAFEERDGRLVPHPYDHTIMSDPEAARIVFDLQDKVPITAVSWQTGREAWLTKAELARLRATDNPAAAYLEERAIDRRRERMLMQPHLYPSIEFDPDMWPDDMKVTDISDVMTAKTLLDLDVLRQARTPVFRVRQVGLHAIVGAFGVSAIAREKLADVKAEVLQTVARGFTISR